LTDALGINLDPVWDPEKRIRMTRYTTKSG